MRVGLCCLLACLATSCIQGSYNQRTVNEPIDSERLQQLEVGRDDLTSCLLALGAPVDVREYEVAEDGTSGMALVWFWSRQVGWGLRASWSLARGVSARYTFDWAGTNMPGCVLWFDRDLKLTAYREGLVGDFLDLRRRPSAAPAIE